MTKKLTNPTDLQKMEYEFHSKHRSYLVSEKHAMEHKYSQLLVYLNSGIFTVSNVIANYYKTLDYKILLLTSWASAWLSLILILLSFLSSIKSFNTEISSWDKNRKESDSNCFTILTRFLTLSSTFLLIVAVISAFIFFSLNFFFMDDTRKTFIESEPVSVQKSSEPVSSGTSPTEFFVTPPTQGE